MSLTLPLYKERWKGKKRIHYVPAFYMQIESGHRRGSRGAAPPLPLRAPLELSRELVVGASGAAGRCGRGAGSLVTLAALSASLAAQDGRHLARRAHPEARDGDQGTVSGLGLYSGARGARGFVGFGVGGGRQRREPPARSRLLPPPCVRRAPYWPGRAGPSARQPTAYYRAPGGPASGGPRAGQRRPFLPGFWVRGGPRWRRLGSRVAALGIKRAEVERTGPQPQTPSCRLS